VPAKSIDKEKTNLIIYKKGVFGKPLIPQKRNLAEMRGFFVFLELPNSNDNNLRFFWKNAL
jgi:hypothetical protein